MLPEPSEHQSDTSSKTGLESLRESVPNASDLSAFQGRGIQGVAPSSVLEHSHREMLLQCETVKVSGEMGNS